MAINNIGPINCASYTTILPIKDYPTHVLDFKSIDSSVLNPFSFVVTNREDFLFSDVKFPPPVIGKSPFVSNAMVEHLMRNKKARALNVKYVLGDQITNMEGALHTFVTPVCPVFMTGNYRWVGRLIGDPFEQNQVRPVILSAAIHPDFEDTTVMMPLVSLQKEAVEGVSLSDKDPIPTAHQKRNDDFRAAYEKKLHQHMIYHLLPTHRLPGRSEITANKIQPQNQILLYLNRLIQADQIPSNIEWPFMEISGSCISLELLYQVYVQQVRNEFKVLNARLTQGYVYTIDPPSIFARTIGGAQVLNRLQALAFKSLAHEGLFSNLKVLGYNDYADNEMVGLFQKALPNVKVLSQTELFTQDGTYQGRCSRE